MFTVTVGKYVILMMPYQYNAPFRVRNLFILFQDDMRRKILPQFINSYSEVFK